MFVDVNRTKNAPLSLVLQHASQKKQHWYQNLLKVRLDRTTCGMDVLMGGWKCYPSPESTLRSLHPPPLRRATPTKPTAPLRPAALTVTVTKPLCATQPRPSPRPFPVLRPAHQAYSCCCCYCCARTRTLPPFYHTAIQGRDYPRHH